RNPLLPSGVLSRYAGGEHSLGHVVGPAPRSERLIHALAFGCFWVLNTPTMPTRRAPEHDYFWVLTLDDRNPIFALGANQSKWVWASLASPRHNGPINELRPRGPPMTRCVSALSETNLKPQSRL